MVRWVLRAVFGLARQFTPAGHGPPPLAYGRGGLSRPLPPTALWDLHGRKLQSSERKMSGKVIGGAAKVSTSIWKGKE